MSKVIKSMQKRYATIKNKLLLYTFTIIILMAALSLYSIFVTSTYKSRIDNMFERNLVLNEVESSLSTVDSALVVYLSTKESNSLNNYMREAEVLRGLIDSMVEELSVFSDEELMLLDIQKMTNNYLVLADDAISNRRKSIFTTYTRNYQDASKIKTYIESYINELNVRQLDRNAVNYTHMTQKINESYFLNTILLVDLVLLSIIIVLRMSRRIIHPIVSLSRSAEAIAGGDFETEKIIVKTNDELEILARAFNKMRRSINEHIDTLKEKAYTEAKLKDQEMENLKMKSLLDVARLYALQSQMNPHFLFNTINAGVQLSVLEGADKTGEFLETMSRLFRYNIKHLSDTVTVEEEVNNVRDYYELLKVRFGDRIHFDFDVDTMSAHCLIPPLTLQPIVENAYIHGLSPKEEEGCITIRIEAMKSFMKITVEDNGVGMTQKQIESIDRKLAWEHQHQHDYSAYEKEINGESERSNGVGIVNVIERLELFYGEQNIFHIESEKNKGTKVVMNLPMINEVKV